MKKIAIVVGSLSLACILLLPSAAQTTAARPALASCDWSVKSPHNLAANPPTTELVQKFVNAAFREDYTRVCAFRFADLRHSGNLSLVVDIDGGGTGGCNITDIFDKTPSGFEDYTASAVLDDDIGKSINDINHDGNLELVLWAPLAPSEMSDQCDAEWPLIFAWTGNGYTEVSNQYKQYYQKYLNSLNKQIAFYSSRTKEVEQGAGQTPKSEPMITPGHWGAGSGGTTASGRISIGQQATVPAPAASVDAAPTPDPGDYACDIVQAAKTEQFLGIHSDATIRDAIKACESDDPNQRKLAAIVLSYIGTQEAMADLKGLANDSDSSVAKVAKERLSYGADPGDYEVTMEPIVWGPPIVQLHRTP